MARPPRPHDDDMPPLLVFVVVLVTGAAVLHLVRVLLHTGPRFGNIMFVALPIVAVLYASRHADRR